MAIEDAIILMFMLMAEDAQKDLKDMLDDMKTTQKQKQAMRELANQMRKEICRLMDQRESTAPRA